MVTGGNPVAYFDTSGDANTINNSFVVAPVGQAMRIQGNSLGNLISNSVIVGIAFTISPKLGLIALVFLVVLHKLEYILNSKIIGKRIKNPMWLTLLALLLGERLMGIPGMILAPVILNYIKIEASNIEVNDEVPDAAAKSAG